MFYVHVGTCRSIFTNPGTGKPYGYQEVFQKPELAEIINTVSTSGKDYFYNGTLAEEMTTPVNDQKGFIILDDMRRYQTRRSLNTSYNGRKVFVSGNDCGGAELMEKLYLMELAGIGQTRSSNYLINATGFFWLASISRYSFFVATYLHSTSNGMSILKENLDFNLSNR